MCKVKTPCKLRNVEFLFTEFRIKLPIESVFHKFDAAQMIK